MSMNLECKEGADSLLLCEEDNSSFLDDAGCFELEGKMGSAGDGGRRGGGLVGGDGLCGMLPVQSEECLGVMVEKEKEYEVGEEYVRRLRIGDLDLGERSSAVDWIVKAHAHFGFGPLCAYQAINFLDRFLSAYELPKGQGWTAQLLAVACLSIAVKMEETDIPFMTNLQACGSKYVFEPKTIQRMELLVLSTLKWRMQAITPYSFIDSFLHIINGDKDPSRTVSFKAIKLISNVNRGTELLEFKPSEIAAAVALSLTEGDKSLFSISQYVEKERVVKCVEMMNKLGLISVQMAKCVANRVAAYVPQSPIGVLDRVSSMSYRSYETATISTACVSNKRRKLNRPSEMEL